MPKKILEIDVCTLMSLSSRMGTGCRHILSDEISRTAGFVNCFPTVPEVYLPHGMVGRHFSASTKTELNEKRVL